ncbi:MAG: guanylate kinase, partial [Actinomycetota bacterium]
MPKLLVISGPSGAGKTSIAAGVLRRRPDIVLSVSSTTRAPRAGERDGVDYRFLSEDAFDDLASSGGFLEHARVHGNRYGTPRAPVEAARQVSASSIRRTSPTAA